MAYQFTVGADDFHVAVTAINIDLMEQNITVDIAKTNKATFGIERMTFITTPAEFAQLASAAAAANVYDSVKAAAWSWLQGSKKDVISFGHPLQIGETLPVWTEVV